MTIIDGKTTQPFRFGRLQQKLGHCGTKRMNTRQLKSLLSHWGTPANIQPLSGGYRNQAWLVEIDGVPRVAKTTRRSEAALRWLEPVHDAAEAAGIVSPRLLANRSGQLTQDGLTVEMYIRGAAIDLVSLPELLKRLNNFHQNTTNLPQRPSFASSQELLDQDIGGDVDLSSMPTDLASACRSAWRPFSNEPQSVVHGDLNLSNLLLTPEGRLALVDWDESRYDASIFDRLALIPQEQLCASEQRALLAWEIAVCWHVEYDYAQGLAARLI